MTVPVGNYPIAVDINPVTNKIYVSNVLGGTVTVIDGVTNNTTTVAGGTSPSSVAVNPSTNKIYVANRNSGNVTVIDGVTNNAITIPVATTPTWLAINPATNKIYISSTGTSATGFVTVMDGATNTTTLLSVDAAPGFVAVNPVTNQVYVSNSNSNDVTIITDQQAQPIPLTTSITPLTGNQTSNPNPTFTFNAFSTTVAQPNALFYQVDTWQNTWSAATGSNPTFTGAVSGLQPGFHILYAYATDGEEATSTQAVSPLTGAIQAYGFLVTPAAGTATFTGCDTSTRGTWTGHYGSDGQLIANGLSNVPSYAQVNFSGSSAWTWANPSSDPRSLQTASNSSTRIASTYYSNSFVIDVNLTDGNTHNISLYLCDWDYGNRTETITIVDAASNVALSTQTFQLFQAGFTPPGASKDMSKLK